MKTCGQIDARCSPARIGDKQNNQTLQEQNQDWTQWSFCWNQNKYQLECQLRCVLSSDSSKRLHNYTTTTITVWADAAVNIVYKPHHVPRIPSSADRCRICHFSVTEGLQRASCCLPPPASTKHIWRDLRGNSRPTAL